MSSGNKSFLTLVVGKKKQLGFTKVMKIQCLLSSTITVTTKTDTGENKLVFIFHFF
jgi:hypothetical protein